jgi:hypothetical protein
MYRKKSVVGKIGPCTGSKFKCTNSGAILRPINWNEKPVIVFENISSFQTETSP